MAIKLNNPIIKQEATTIVTPEIQIDVIDIDKAINIETDRHMVTFNYTLYQYERDLSGDVVELSGKPNAFAIESRSQKVGDQYYSTMFNTDVSGKLGEIIEEKLFEWVGMFDKDVSGHINDVESINEQDLNIIGRRF